MTSVNREIWSDVVKEENLCETLLKLTTPTIADEVDNPKTATSQNSRDIESYQYKSKKVSDAEINVKKRQQQQRNRRRSCPESSSKFSAVSELDSDEAVVLAIVKYLNEPKTEIIRTLESF